MNIELLATMMSFFFVKTPEPRYWEKRMVRIGVNHGSDDKVSQAIELMERAKKVNYNGVIISDLSPPALLKCGALMPSLYATKHESLDWSISYPSCISAAQEWCEIFLRART